MLWFLHVMSLVKSHELFLNFFHLSQSDVAKIKLLNKKNYPLSDINFWLVLHCGLRKTRSNKNYTSKLDKLLCNEGECKNVGLFKPSFTNNRTWQKQTKCITLWYAPPSCCGHRWRLILSYRLPSQRYLSNWKLDTKSIFWTILTNIF